MKPPEHLDVDPRTLCVLILAGIPSEAVFERLSAARGCPVPETPEQRQWIIQFARELTPASA
jgi:hypothetical protein